MASSIKEIFETLQDKDKALLRYAFEHDLAQIVELDDGSYIGINADRIPNLVPELVTGSWSIGHSKRTTVVPRS